MSYIDYAKPITTDETIAKLKGRIAQLQRRHDAFYKIVPILKKYEGKAVSKRIETALKTAFPNDLIHFREIAGMTYIVFRSESAQGYDDREEFLLCYHSDPTYNEDRFVNKHNPGMELVRGDIENLERGIKKAAALVKRYNAILEAGKALCEDSKDCGLEYELDILHRNK